jgi:hypothetical protein
MMFLLGKCGNPFSDDWKRGPSKLDLGEIWKEMKTRGALTDAHGFTPCLSTKV